MEAKLDKSRRKLILTFNADEASDILMWCVMSPLENKITKEKTLASIVYTAIVDHCRNMLGSTRPREQEGG